MSLQNFFYITTSSAIILITLLFVVLIIIGIIIAIRLAKTFKKIHQASETVDNTVKEIKEKLKMSALFTLVGEGLKEIILSLKEKREDQNQPKNKK